MPPTIETIFFLGRAIFLAAFFRGPIFWEGNFPKGKISGGNFPVDSFLGRRFTGFFSRNIFRDTLLPLTIL